MSSGMSVQQILNAATAANATAFAAGDAARAWQEAKKNAITCRIALLQHEESYLSRTTSFPLVFTREKTVTGDHAIICAQREIVRDVFNSMFRIKDSVDRVLIVGAAARELRLYNANPNIHYWVHGKENKDYDRVIREAYNDIMKTLKTKASKGNRKLFLPPPSQVDTERTRPVVKRYHEVSQIFRDYVRVHQLPNTVHLEPIEANTLVFEDSAYNYTEEMFCDLFAKTKANFGYGYMLLPNELMWPDIPSNRMYYFHKYKDAAFGPWKAALTWKHGYSNGYVHDHDAWSTLLRKPVLRANGITLVVEVNPRIGAMAIFKITKVHHAEDIIRTIELPDSEMYVKLLDLWGSVNHKTCKVSHPLKYFAVRELEYLQTIHFLTSIDPKSLNLQTCFTFVRRNYLGVGLSTKEVQNPWELPRVDIERFCVAVTLQAYIMVEKNKKMFDNAKPTSTLEKFMAMIRRGVRMCFWPIAEFVDWLFSEHLVDKIVVYPDGLGRSTQLAKAIPSEEPFLMEMTAAFPNEEDAPECPFCRDASYIDPRTGKSILGDQILDCHYKHDSNHTFKMSQKEVDEMFQKLADDDEDPPNLAAVKKAAKEVMPKSGFEHTCRVTYIRGGPGCGKSVMIRGLADVTDLILAPFNKLMPEYRNVIDKDTGERVNLEFKTQHRGINTAGHRRIFVDEFTSFPYEFLAVIAYRNGCDEIILVGDERQTKVIEPDEGLYIGNHIDLESLSTHELLVNFRNPKDVIALLNTKYGYKMRGHKGSLPGPSIHFVSSDDQPQVDIALRMAFTKASAQHWIENKKATVRANQGGTTDVAILYATEKDGDLPMVSELAIVGLSRHREHLYIVTDGGHNSQKFMESLGLTAEFMLHIQTFIEFPSLDTKQISDDDPVVKQILNVELEHGPKDAYKLIETLVPPEAMNDDIIALNEGSSSVVSDTFRSAKGFIDEITACGVNPRGHPKPYKQKYYSVGAGWGLHFLQGDPYQELGVVSKRYDNPKPKYIFDEDAKKVAEKIVDRYFEECKTERYIDMWKDWDEEKINEIVNVWLKQMAAKHYPQQYRGALSDESVVRFHLKNIFKPDTTSKDLDVYKAGQGISAWSSDLASLFCLAWRIINDIDRLTERNDADVTVLTDNGIDEVAFLESVNAAMAKLNGYPVQHGIADAVMFDSFQNKWTQYIEYYYWKKLGVNESFLAWYYSYRSGTKMIGMTFSLIGGEEKHSGEPNTLGNNGVVMKTLANHIIRGNGPRVQCYKGDDFDKCQMNLKIDELAKEEVESYCPLKIKVMIKQAGEFCGMTISQDGMTPNLKRRIDRIAGMRWRSYDHFCEYQKSIRDYMEVVKKIGINKCLANTVANTKCNISDAETMLYCIESWGHINKEQWLSMVKERTQSVSIPVPDDFSLFGVRILVN